MVEFNADGGLEISPGPRGFSVTGVELSEDGTIAYFTTDAPGRLNGVSLPVGPRGPRGEYGDPGEARLRVDTDAGYRIFFWDTATTGEHMVHGDTGVRQLPNGTRVHRTMNTVTTTAADPTTLPAGFRPSVAGATGTYLTTEAWPTQLPGTELVAPVTNRGLEGYTAAVAQGFTGTPQQWIEAVYGVLPTNGTVGQYLGWTTSGPAWIPLPQIGPGPWVNITLNPGWRASTGRPPQVRHNNGTVEMIGGVTYIGPAAVAGVWGTDFVKIGNLPPGYIPDSDFDYPVRVHRGDPVGTMNFPVVGRVNINKNGELFLAAFYYSAENRTIRVEAGETAVDIGALPSFPLRNSN